MKTNNGHTHDSPVRGGGHVPLGKILLELRNAIRRAEQCRLDLRRLGFSMRRWQEIVKDVDPALRFLVRPQVMDAIIIHLESAREPVSREVLVLALAEQGEGPPDRIRNAVTTNLRARKLVLHPDDKIGLPPRKKRA
jgi:hypothetical protein